MPLFTTGLSHKTKDTSSLIEIIRRQRENLELQRKTLFLFRTEMSDNRKKQIARILGFLGLIHADTSLYGVIDGIEHVKFLPRRVHGSWKRDMTSVKIEGVRAHVSKP